MHLESFDYPLPEDLIAQSPADRRDSSRLLVLRRDSGSLAHHVYSDLPGLLERRRGTGHLRQTCLGGIDLVDEFSAAYCQDALIFHSWIIQHTFNGLQFFTSAFGSSD